MGHELVVLADKIDWAWLDAELAESFSDRGRPAEPVRFMLGMFLPKHTYGLSDEQVWDRWVFDPHFQYFTGEEFFQHELPHERSGMSHWRKRIGDKLDILLAEALQGLQIGAKTRRPWPDQKRAPTAPRHRSGDRSLQDRRPSGPQFS